MTSKKSVHILTEAINIHSLDSPDLTCILKQIIESLADPIVVINNNFEIIGLNKPMVAFFKELSPAEYEQNDDSVIGRKCHQIFLNKQTACETCEHLEAIRKNGIEKRFINELTDKTFNIQITPLKDISGKVIATVHILTDITEQLASRQIIEFQKRTSVLVTGFVDLRQAVKSFTGLISEIFDVDCFLRFSYKNINMTECRIESPEDKTKTKIDYLSKIADQTMRLKTPLIINRNDLQKKNIGTAYFAAEHKDLAPLICLPAHDEKAEDGSSDFTGILLIKIRKPRQITDKEIEKFKQVSERLGSCLRKVLLFSELLHRNHELDVINSISERISRSVGIESIIKESLESIMKVMGAEVGAIKLNLDNDEKDLFSSNSALEQSFNWAISKNEKNVTSPNNLIDIENCSSVAIPIMAAKEQKGSIFICLEPEQSLGETDLRLLLVLAGQIGMAIDKAKLYYAIKREKDIHKSLSQKIIESVEKERKRISMDLHDNMLQLLIGSDYLLQSIDGEKPEIYDQLTKISEILNEAIFMGRKLITEIMPPSLESIGLGASIEDLTIKATSGKNIDVECKLVDSVSLPGNYELAMYRIAQEAIHNAVKHSNASMLKCSLVHEKDYAVLTVQDNGSGFDYNSKLAALNNGHIGLLSMRERAALCGGVFEVRSSKSKGTTVKVKIPLTTSS